MQRHILPQLKGHSLQDFVPHCHIRRDLWALCLNIQITKPAIMELRYNSHSCVGNFKAIIQWLVSLSTISILLLLVSNRILSEELVSYMMKHQEIQSVQSMMNNGLNSSSFKNEFEFSEASLFSWNVLFWSVHCFIFQVLHCFLKGCVAVICPSFSRVKVLLVQIYILDLKSY